MKSGKSGILLIISVEVLIAVSKVDFGPLILFNQSSSTGLETSQMFVSGYNLLATPSTTTMVFCNRRRGVCVGILNLSVISNNWANKFPPEISLIDWPKIGSPTDLNAWANSSLDASWGTKPAWKWTSATLL